MPVLRDCGYVRTEPQAAFACIRCWKLKKKCDRLTPRCKRCTLLNVGCVYSSQPPTERAESLRLRTSNAVSLYEHHRCTAPPTPPSKAVSPNTRGISEEPGLLAAVSIHQLFDGLLSEQLNEAFNSIKPELVSTCNQYLNTINTSLPIIIEAHLRKDLEDAKGVSKVEHRVLLLSIYLVTRIPLHSCEGGTDLGNLYSILKPFYADLTSKRNPSVHMIQAGLLMAIYEHGQAYDETAYLTLGVCARLGHAIGLHKSLHEDLPSDLSSRDQIQTHKHVWWSIIILERIFALESQDPRRPLAIIHPTLDSHIPSFCGHDAELSLPVGRFTENEKQFGEIAFTPANSYARSCQATYLLSRIFQHMGNEAKDSTSRHAEAKYLDQSLQALSKSIIDQSNREIGVPWEYSCTAFMICMLALGVLHQYNLFPDSQFIQSQEQQDFARTSRVALQSIARIAIDGARTKLDDRVEGARNSPPFALHFFRTMAIAVLQMGQEEGKSMEELMAETRSLTTYLSVSSERWKLAGRHLDAIESVAAELYEKRALA